MFSCLVTFHAATAMLCQLGSLQEIVALLAFCQAVFFSFVCPLSQVFEVDLQYLI